MKLLSHVAAFAAVPILFGIVGTKQSIGAGVVGNGTPASCTEAALDTALGCGPPNGQPVSRTCNGGGTVTFNCGPSPDTITVSISRFISTDTTIDGGGLMTISGGNSVQVFLTNS